MRLPDMRELVGSAVNRFENLPDAYKERIHRFLDTVPVTPTCLHGDLHIGNIITDGSRDLWIDVGDFAYGVPEWDLCMMYHATNFISAQRADSIFHLDNDTLRAHWAAFAPVYYGTSSEEVLAAKVRKLQPFVAAKMVYLLTKLFDGKHPFSEFIHQLIDKNLPE